MANEKKTKNKQYALNKSPFFKLQSKARLAETLTLPLETLRVLASNPSNACYRMFADKKSGRFITEPHGEMAVAHRRIAKLLARISPPLFLHSATKGRSYKTNAAEHRRGGGVFKVDIRSYYTSISFGAVYRFFKDKLCCSIDVATLLSKICTVSVNGRTHLPTGSSLSPVLSYWVYADLFNSINSLCAARDCKMSLYVDDLTISGANADKSLLALVKKRIGAAGLRAHKIKFFGTAPATVTGVVVYGKRLSLPHSRARDIREHLKLLPTAGAAAGKTLSVLIGKLNEAQQFVRAYSAIKERVLARHALTWKQVTDERVRKSRAALARRRRKAARASAGTI